MDEKLKNWKANYNKEPTSNGVNGGHQTLNNTEPIMNDLQKKIQEYYCKTSNSTIN